MAENYTREQLDTMSRKELVQAFLKMQEGFSVMQKNYENTDRQMQLLLEQLADNKRHRFGRSSERLEDDGQISFFESDPACAVFNEAECVSDLPEEEPKKRGAKKKGKRE
ncbi:MAG: transposase, partial [Lachnospiraceae bacterium]|nr:transposase [Lachnospiraceae bacterium]